MIKPEYRLLLDTKDVLLSNGLMQIISMKNGVGTYQSKKTYTNRPLIRILENNMTIRYDVIESVIVEV